MNAIANAPALFDLKSTPINSITPGVEILATISENLTHGHFLKQINKPISIIILLIIILLFVVAANHIKKIYLHIAILFSFISIYIITAIYLYSSIALLLPVFVPVVSLLLTFTVLQSAYYLVEGKQKRKLKRMFNHYVDANVVSHLMENPNALKLGGECKELTVFFSDIAGFTTLSENMNPEELVEFLNEYLGEMANIIIENGGYLDKYIGDAIMAVFGVPVIQHDSANKACVAALDNIEKLEQLKKKWGEHSADFSIRIGISTGPMVVGNIGFHSRMDYTVIGDTVNLGSRLEGVNKQFDTLIILDEATKKLISNEFLTRELDLVAVKGKTKPVRIFELLNSSFDSDLLEKYKAGLDLYKQRKWKEAKHIFEELRTKYKKDGPTKVYIKRCNEFVSNPPDSDWDGVFRLDVK